LLKPLFQLFASPIVTSYSVSLGVNALVVLALFLWGGRGLLKKPVEVMVLYGEFAAESQASAGQTATQSESFKLLTETPREPTLEPIHEARQRAPRRDAPAPLDGDQPSRGDAGSTDQPLPLVVLPPPSPPRDTTSAKPVAPPRSASLARPAGGRVGSRTPIINRGNNRPPIYPPTLLHQRVEGTVLLELHISPSGNVVRAVILRSSGHSLFDAAAVNAAQTWQGEPAVIDGVPVETIETQEVIFRVKRG
jgi:TonB family protein